MHAELHRQRWTRLIFRVWLALAVGLVLPADGRTSGAGAALLPDLVTLRPTDLYLSREVLADGQTHLLLRFTATAWNAGEGRLELVAVPEPDGGSAVWQVLYDAPTGGQVVARRRLAADLVDHPQHHHIHLTDFFGFALHGQGPLGISWPVRGATGKLSSCVFDDILVDQSPPRPRQYRDCGAERQGLSPAWGDRYDASLPDQWVDLGAGPLRDGVYTLHVTVDPLDRIDEGGREANQALTTFVVRDGQIVGRPEPARCAVVGKAVGPVGASVELSCAHFPEGVPVAVYWDGWDPWAEPPLRPIANFVGAGATSVGVHVLVPEAPAGGHNVTAVAGGVGDEAATVIYAVEPA
ncbi:MAG: hypothetical protein K0S78_4306 [Thermomicrobiales bacterium]|nr:hypothetical protein [Thermomicrobiales bacterium]